MRRWVIAITATLFTWSQVVQAYPQADVPALKAFLQNSGWAKEGLTLKQFYDLTKETLPLDFRFEIEQIMKKYPNAKMPKIEIRMVKNGTAEDVQLIAQQGRESATALLSFRGNQIGELTYQNKGKNVHRKIEFTDVINPVQMMASAYGPGTGLSERIEFTRLMHENELALLRPQDRSQYAEQVREVIRVAEKAQNVLKIADKKREPATPKKSKKTSSYFLWESLLPKAYAESPSDGEKCLSLGWIGEYKGGTCNPPAEAIDAARCPQAAKCSTLLYGAEAPCGRTRFEPGELNSTAELCNTRSKDNKYDFFKGIKTQQEFDQKMDELSLKLNEIRALCQKPKNEQVNECKDLEIRMAALKAANCQVLKKWKDQFTDLRCNKPEAGADLAKKAPPKKDAPTQTVTEEVTTGGTDGQGMDGEGGVTVVTKTVPVAKPEQERVEPDRGEPIRPANKPEVLNSTQCEGLPVYQSGLDCAGGQVKSVSCQIQNEIRTHFYCSCGDLREKFARSARPVGCESETIKRSSDTDSGRERYRSRYRASRSQPRQEKSWWEENGGWQGMLGGVMTIAVGGLSFYLQQQALRSQWNQYYNMYQTSPLRIAPPPMTTLNPLGTGSTTPIIYGR